MFIKFIFDYLLESLQTLQCIKMCLNCTKLYQGFKFFEINIFIHNFTTLQTLHFFKIENILSKQSYYHISLQSSENKLIL